MERRKEKGVLEKTERQKRCEKVTVRNGNGKEKGREESGGSEERRTGKEENNCKWRQRGEGRGKEEEGV